MESDQPSQIPGVALVKSELRNVELQVLSEKPEPKGFMDYRVSIAPEFLKKDGTSSIDWFIQKVEATLKAFPGDPSKPAPQNVSPLLTCKINFILRYKVSDTEQSEEGILKQKAYFESHSSIIARALMKSILRETSFATIPIPFGA
ncbi:MAG: hypothetical protein V1929_09965 [bacterium]